MSVNTEAILINLSCNQEVQITKDTFSVGRSLQADYVLNSLAVSRIHFIFERKDGIWTIRDTSSNGTIVNDRLIKSSSIEICGGDLIKIRGGSVTMKFTLNTTTTTRFVTSVADFVSTPNEDNIPSVSNDHCYERTGVEEVKTSAEGVFTISSVSRPSSPNTSEASNVISYSNLKRDRSPEEAEGLKKNKTENKPPVRDNLKEELECSICQELFIKAVTLNCSHTFCNACILKWKNQRNYCPICRNPITTISPSIVLDNIVEKLVADVDQKAREQREETIENRRLEEQIAVMREVDLRLLWLLRYRTADDSPLLYDYTLS